MVSTSIMILALLSLPPSRLGSRHRHLARAFTAHQHHSVGLTRGLRRSHLQAHLNNKNTEIRHGATGYPSSPPHFYNANHINSRITRRQFSSVALQAASHDESVEDDLNGGNVIEEEEFTINESKPAPSIRMPDFVGKASQQSSTDPTSSSSLFEVTAPFDPTGDQPAAIEELCQQLQQGNRFAVLQGITGTGKTLVMSHVIAKHGRPTLVLCHNKTLAAQVARELRNFLGKNAVELFVSYYNHYVPESYNEVSGKYVAKKSSINQDIDAMRHRATRALLMRNDVVIVASVSCIYGLGLPKEYLEASQNIQIGDSMPSPEEFLGMLHAQSYGAAPTDDDFGRGKYQIISATSSQWDITLWPPHESFPLRIELTHTNQHNFVGDNSQSMNDWHISSIQQGHAHGHGPIESTCLFPAKHHVMSEDRVEEACLAIEEECRHRVQELTKEGKHDEALRLQQRVYNDVLMLRETGYCAGAENYSRHLAGRLPGEPPATLMDYLAIHGRDWLLMMDESHVTLPQLRAMYGGDQARKRRLVKHGYRLPSALDNRPLQEEEFWQRVQQAVFISATPSPRELSLSEASPVEMVVRPTYVCDPVIHVRPKEGQLSDLIDEIKSRQQRQERTLAVALTKRDAEDLADYLTDSGVESTFIHSGLNTQERADALKALQSGEVSCLVGVNLLREGLDLPQVSLVAILNADSEGFLRSETALLQTVGRAARNVQGEAIFYANRVTQSMQKCIDATEYRRQKQLAYNRENGCRMQSTKGSSMLSIFDLLKDQIAEEKPLEVVGRRNAPSSASKNLVDNINTLQKPDVTVTVDTAATDVNTEHVPSTPGVYFWKDSEGNILYIGKAKKLRSRVRSYLAPSAKHSARIQVMMKKARSIDVMLTKSDREALLLESNLIKHHQPPYNVLLKDDESYPYICASVGDPFPRFFIAPRRHEETNGQSSARKYRYFGPYPHFREINAILEGIEAKYDLRAKSFMARHGSDETTKEEYNQLFQNALEENFSHNHHQSTQLAKMRSQYEEAGILFDADANCSRDVVALAEIPGDNSHTTAVVHVVQFRNGLVAGRFSYNVELPSGLSTDNDRAAAIQHVLERRHYPSGEESPDKSFSFFPDEIMIQYLTEDAKELKQSIRAARKQVEPDRKDNFSVRTVVTKGPRKQTDRRAIEFAIENAKQAAFERSLENVGSVVKSSVDGTALTELASLLNLDREPSRIECYDVSHSQGDFPVASRVVFIDGKPARDLYRKFNIKTVDGIDDYASLEETLSRRFKRAWVNGEGGPVDKKDPWSIPDVVLIDGGPGQLSAAAKGMARARVFPAEQDQTTAVLASSPVEVKSGEKRSATVAVCSLAKNHEELFVFGAKKPVNDSPDSPALLLLRALRDESHRFALKAHRSRRSIRKQEASSASQ